MATTTTEAGIHKSSEEWRLPLGAASVLWQILLEDGQRRMNEHSEAA